MNKHSTTNKRPAKSSRSTAARKLSPRRANGRSAARKPEQAGVPKVAAPKIAAPKIAVPKIAVPKIAVPKIAAIDVAEVSISETTIARADLGKVSVSAVATIGSALRAHKFRVGQTVSYTSSPISRPGASGSYKVVRLLPSDGDDYQYRIKHAGEAFERVAKESQLELES